MSDFGLAKVKQEGQEIKYDELSTGGGYPKDPPMTIEEFIHAVEDSIAWFEVPADKLSLIVEVLKMSKGSWYRPHDKEKFDAGWDRIFSKEEDEKAVEERCIDYEEYEMFTEEDEPSARNEVRNTKESRAE